MNWPTIIVAAVVAIIFVSIITVGFINRAKGKSSCSCGGSCGSCGMNCHQNKEN